MVFSVHELKMKVKVKLPDILAFAIDQQWTTVSPTMFDNMSGSSWSRLNTET